jgi:siroheme synthase
VPLTCLHLQGEIHELLLQFAEAGATVVRLKGGDPYVFGRYVLARWVGVLHHQIIRQVSFTIPGVITP